MPPTPTNSLETLLGVEDHMWLSVKCSYMYVDWNMCLCTWSLTHSHVFAYVSLNVLCTFEP